MQLHVDTDQEPIAGLMLLSRLLMDYANMKAQNEKAAEDKYPVKLDAHQHTGPVLTVHDTAFGTIAPGMTIVDASGRELGTVVGPEPDPAALSTKSPFTVPTGATPPPPFANVVPLFPQPSLNLPGATGPATLGVNTAGGAQAETNTAPSTSTPAAPVAGASGAVSAEVDSAGLPWDARIHSSSKAKKGDGTWKIKRGLEAGVAERITAELMAAKLPPSVSSTPTVAGLGNLVPLMGTAGVSPVFATSVPNVAETVTPQSDATVTLPPGLQTSAVHMPPLAGSAPAYSASVPIPVPPSVPGVPVPPTPAVGAVPVPGVNPVIRFSQMMTKISNALGARTITQEQVTAAHKGQQLDQLQQAVLNPDKIPLIEAALGLA